MDHSFQRIDQLKAEWDSLQPLAPEQEHRLWQKLRLEWNYHSNHIEGNTLTYGETELLLLHDQTSGTHTLREYEEMKAHDVGIEYVRRLAGEKDRLIVESDIRDLNKTILKEPFWKAAQTADGQSTRKEIIPGQYKQQPNNVRTATGEMFEFAAPAEVSARMEKLVAWLRTNLEDHAVNPAIVAAKLHHEFVLIHPFDDGNGRVARMLVNYFFLYLGYPPVIVPSEKKAEYLAALRLADAGELETLVSFLGERLEKALEMGIRAAKGESIEEPGDLEKEIAIFVRNQNPQSKIVKTFSRETLGELYQNTIKNIFNSISAKASLISPLFAESKTNYTNRGSIIPINPHELFTQNSPLPSTIHSFGISYEFQGYKGNASAPFSISEDITLEFTNLYYIIALNNSTPSKNLMRKIGRNQKYPRLQIHCFAPYSTR